MKENMHKPVLLDAFLDVVKPLEGARWIDGTFGRGGHSLALLQAGVSVLAFDLDHESRGAAEELAKKWKGFTWQQKNYKEMRGAMKEQGWESVHGVLLDLGVSSPQVDQAQRGFSFMKDGPLDMRMDQEAELSASDVVNTWSEKSLADIFWVYGEERKSRRLANAIVKRRMKEKFYRTEDLANTVKKVLGDYQGRKTHPATRVFQALRIAVNDEIRNLEEGLEESVKVLEGGGVLSVICFHSGEDRKVKHFMKNHSEDYSKTLDGERLGESVWFSKTRRELPSQEEINNNTRSRSARLRVAWKRSVSK